ncbi:DNA alkylation repair protein [Clostridium sp. D33t1_170424_F3]|uniref:DNA alkylation repair protein n=1 Tax=Clostridium sp. D33t1_170424_F3 TaxID=2787099 RepID=UPI0018A9A2DF|nr:DNA alkylation repair protein [Clostridium sp. D33t1_170424_F3]
MPNDKWIVPEEICAVLETLAEPDYQKFASSLLPGVPEVLGVRLPRLRKLAKRIVREDWRGFLKQSKGRSFEEKMLRGMVIGYAPSTLEERLAYVEAFLPEIDNWSTCDSFCSGLKFAREEPERVWEFLRPYLRSQEEFTVRFAVVMLLFYFVQPDGIGRVLRALDGVKHEGYYARMAVAWALSVCYTVCPAETMAYFKTCALDDFTFHKALQKITESRQVGAAEKAVIRAMKRKGQK